ncbi:MAG: trypsin-like peptidase domain-containing protein [Oscillospiraceae bacterium]|nr:trypsin-like peptidase domain-containing protein [Oscillospiraceae bacterium]
MYDQNENRQNPDTNPVNYGAYYQSEQNPENNANTGFPNQNSTASYVNYYSDPNEQPKKSGGGKIFLKIVAGLAALAIVSVSSIELYKLFGTKTDLDGNKSSAVNTSVTEQKKDDAEEQKGDDSEQAKPSGNSGASWISMAAAEDALSIPDIVDKALPSVVGISAIFERTEKYSWGFYQYEGPTQQIPGTGTGIVLNEDGFIITNAHCIYDSDAQSGSGKAVKVSVVMGDEDSTEYEAEIVGYDLETDLAVLKIDAENLVPAEFGDSDKLRVGELVVAIGNPLGFELFGTTTCGIVSALNREVTINEQDMTLIQTDTSINSGNSGGPLLNCYGQVIGINSAKISSNYSSSAASVEGLAFAIPITDATKIIDDLINYGYVAGRPQLGIMSSDVGAEAAQRFGWPEGVYVVSVTPGSAAELAGLRQGDIITEIQGVAVTTTDELNKVKEEYNAGDTITLKIYRAGEELKIDLILQEVKVQK